MNDTYVKARRLPVYILVILALSLLSACASHKQNPALPQSHSQVSLPAEALLADSLPELPDTRSGTSITASTIQGSEFFDKSDNAAVNGSDLQLQSDSDSTSWGIWRMQSGAVLLDVEVFASVPAGNSFYTALADYTTGRWTVTGPYDQDTTLSLDDERHRSPSGSCYVAVLTSGGRSADIDLLEFGVDSLGWQFVNIFSSLHDGAYNSIAVIDGHPALAYGAEDVEDLGDLKYVRSTSSTGASPADWTNIVLVDTEGWTGLDPCLAEVAGRPAISYQDATEDSLRYAYSSTLSGDSPADWTIITVDNNGNVGSDSSLELINGTPAIAYYESIDGSNGYLKYTRSTTPTGTDATDWTIITVDGVGRVGWYPSLKVVDGNPAISYYDLTNDMLKYARSTSDTGSQVADWTQIVVADSDEYTGNYSSLAVVDGFPAISYYKRDTNDLRFVRATSASGELAGDWTQKVTVQETGMVGEYTALAVISGMPAISYYDTDNMNLLYARASTAGGEDAAAWMGSPEIVDEAGNVGSFTHMVELGGRPAISYYDSTNGDLKYAILFD